VAYQFNDTVEMLKAFNFKHSRIHVIFQMPIIKRNPYAIQPQTGEVFGISLGEEISEPAVKEEIVVLLSENFEHGFPVAAFMALVTSVMI
jgi:hypothetical protein